MKPLIYNYLRPNTDMDDAEIQVTESVLATYATSRCYELAPTFDEKVPGRYCRLSVRSLVHFTGRSLVQVGTVSPATAASPGK
jgi:hypothetical protein